MKGIVISGWLAAGVCGAVGGCVAHDAQGEAAAPIGSWKGSVVAFDLGSDGRVSYKDPGIAEFTGRWEWLPATQAEAALVLTPSAPSSANPLRSAILRRKRPLRYVVSTVNGHSSIAPEPAYRA